MAASRYNLAVFTGLVQTTGRVHASVDRGEGRMLAIAAEALSEPDRALGASVSVAGVCLTVTQQGPEGFEVEVAFETLERTTLRGVVVGDRVNLEPSLRVGDPLGGHLVTGHVDGVAVVRELRSRGDARELWLESPPQLLPLIAPKGSVTLDGVSLTVNRVERERFMVGLIPHTLSSTTLSALDVGGCANLEVDVLARYVARLLEAQGSPTAVTRELLAEHGFSTPPKIGRVQDEEAQ